MAASSRSPKSAAARCGRPRRCRPARPATNFTTHAGLGLRVLGSHGRGVIIGYRLHHISNGNRVARNPGVNAHMLVIGWTGIGSR